MSPGEGDLHTQEAVPEQHLGGGDRGEWVGISHKDREAGEILDINDNYDDIDQADPETGEALEDNIVEDTPLLINIKGCGYPPEVNCDEYADKYYNHSLVGMV